MVFELLMKFVMMEIKLMVGDVQPIVKESCLVIIVLEEHQLVLIFAQKNVQMAILLIRKHVVLQQERILLF